MEKFIINLLNNKSQVKKTKSRITMKNKYDKFTKIQPNKLIHNNCLKLIDMVSSPKPK